MLEWIAVGTALGRLPGFCKEAALKRRARVLCLQRVQPTETVLRSASAEGS